MSTNLMNMVYQYTTTYATYLPFDIKTYFYFKLHIDYPDKQKEFNIKYEYEYEYEYEFLQILFMNINFIILKIIQLIFMVYSSC